MSQIATDTGRDTACAAHASSITAHGACHVGVKLLAALPPRSLGLRLQAALLILASGVALGPPANGLMLLAPLPGPATASIGWAWQAGAIPVARGPYPGSYVVNGSITALLIPALSHGALIVSARFAACGTPITKEK